MQWPVPPAPDASGAPAPLEPVATPPSADVDLASEADARLEAVCDELGILVARRVEPVPARVLPFGTEQVAMVEVRTGADDDRRLAADPVSSGRSVLAAALPAAVAEGKVRSAVVFSDGEAPVRWGRADDETRLAALYAVVPHLGSFTATAGSDTYRVLRLPGIGAALVSEGASAATWVEGWFAALVTATRYALAAQQTPTGVVPAPSATPAAPADEADARAAVLEQLERECRRILAAAQDEAREIREAAERDAAAARGDRDAQRDDGQRHDGRHDDAVLHPDDVRREVRAEVDAMLASAERTRADVLADARREAEALRRETEQACEQLLKETRRRAERRRRAARRDVKRIRRKLKALRREAASAKRAGRRAPSPKMVDVVADARRAADDLLSDAQRAADELLRDAARARAQSVLAPVAGPVVSVAPVVGGPVAATSADEAQRTAIALLTAATESVAAMSALLASVADTGRRQRDDGDTPSSRLYFGA